MRTTVTNALVGTAIAVELVMALLVVWYAHDGLRDLIFFAA
jgi:hypothetical protein